MYTFWYINMLNLTAENGRFSDLFAYFEHFHIIIRVWNFIASSNIYKLCVIQSKNVFYIFILYFLHFNTYRKIEVGDLGGVEKITFRLKKDDSVLGMPRLLFVILAGCICVGIIACATMCLMYLQARRKRASNPRNYYNFSLLPQKERKGLVLDDDEETDLFSAPVKSKTIKTLFRCTN